MINKIVQSMAEALAGIRDRRRRVWVLMEHQTKSAGSRLVRRCTYPLTAPGAVKRVCTISPCST